MVESGKGICKIKRITKDEKSNCVKTTEKCEKDKA